MKPKPISITRDELVALEPCDLEQRLALFGRRKSLTAKQAFAAGATISDLRWVAGRLGHKTLLVKFALACAQRTAHLNPDPRVQAALDATQAWLDAPTEENRANAANAAAAAAYAATNATASYTTPAAYAAYAAAAAAYAASAAYAVSAASAASAAAANAAAAYDAGREKETAIQEALFLEIFG